MQVEQVKEQVISILINANVKYDIENFDSGALMIDVEVEDRFYCLELTKNYMGISEIIGEDSEFSSIPDHSYKNLGEFLEKVRIISGVK